MPTDPTTYSIAQDEHYGWLTGFTSDGHQVLSADVGHLFFDTLGVFLRMEAQPRDGEWQMRARELIASAATINVQEFRVPDLDIGVQSMPDRYAAYVRDPNSFSAEDRSRFPDEISSWNEDRLFVFQLGDDFWMNPDGTVNSH